MKFDWELVDAILVSHIGWRPLLVFFCCSVFFCLWQLYAPCECPWHKDPADYENPNIKLPWNQKSTIRWGLSTRRAGFRGRDFAKIGERTVSTPQKQSRKPVGLKKFLGLLFGLFMFIFCFKPSFFGMSWFFQVSSSKAKKFQRLQVCQLYRALFWKTRWPSNCFLWKHQPQSCAFVFLHWNPIQ